MTTPAVSPGPAGAAPFTGPTIRVNPARDRPASTRAEPEVPSADGLRVPGYEVIGFLGSGGMGAVYAATDRTLGREVAVKIVLPGRDGPAGVARFLREAEITARLPHPNIPPVHAVGVLPDGGRFLVMKLVRGRTLSALLHEGNYSAAAALHAFEQVAQAVGFAHSQGVVHRDLKPLNVMVGAFGEVQVMDWGLAKSLGAPDNSGDEAVSAAAGVTRAGTVVGTPGYMAPEQARGEPVDARADVFALGAMLATILTGEPAFVGTHGHDTLRRAAAADLADAHRRLSSCDADAALVRLALACLSPRVEDRPADGRAVADALAEHRAGVESRLRRAEADAVRLTEEARRRRLRRWAVAGVMAALVLGIVGTSVGMFAADDARRKEFEARIAADEANGRTTHRLGQIERINGVFGGMFGDLDLARRKSDGESVEVLFAERLVDAAARIEGESVGDAAAVARLQGSLGLALAALGRSAEALPILQKAHATHREMFGPTDARTLSVQGALAEILRLCGRRAEGLELIEAVVESRKATLGADDPATLSATAALATARQGVGENAAAASLLEDTLRRHRASSRPDTTETLNWVSTLAHAYRNLGRPDKAVEWLRAALAAAKTSLGVDHLRTIALTNNLAESYVALRRPLEALPLYEDALERMKKALGVGHPNTLITLGNLASAYRAAGRFAEAVPLFEETIRRQRIRPGPDHPDTLVTMCNLAVTLRKLGRNADALPLCEEAYRGMKATVGAAHPDAVVLSRNLARTYLDVGKTKEAVPLLRDFVDRSRPMGDAVDAEFEKKLFGTCYDLMQAKALAEAEPFLREMHARMKGRDGQWLTGCVASMLGESLTSGGKYAEAKPLLESGYATMKRHARQIPANAGPQVRMGLDLLIRHAEASGDTAAANRWRAER